MRTRSHSFALLAAALIGTPSLAQCPRPITYELGGQPGPACAANIGWSAVGRGRFVSIENTPFLGAPSVTSRIGLDAPAVHMHTEILGHIWATDGATIYGIDTTIPANPQVVGRITVAGEGFPLVYGITRLRVRGSFVYAISGYGFYIIDISNPAAPVLRSMTLRSYLNDVEVSGSYAYLSIYDNATPDKSILVMDIGDSAHPVEARRVGDGSRRGLRLALQYGTSNLFAIATTPSSAAVERWSLVSAANPAISGVNANAGLDTPDADDDLGVTSTTVCILDRQNTGVDFLRLYGSSSLQSLSAPITMPGRMNGLDVDQPFVYLTRESGQLARVDTTQAGSPVVSSEYLDVMPGECSHIANVNGGYSIVTGPNDLWLFRTVAGSAPVPVYHTGADPGYSFADSPIVLPGDNTVYVREVSATNTAILACTVATQPTPVITRQGTYTIAGTITGMELGYDANSARRFYYTTPSGGNTSTLHVLNAVNLASMTSLYTTSLTSGVSAPLKFLPGSFILGQPSRLLVGGQTKTQILNVDGAPSALGVIPAGSIAYSGGVFPNIWLLDWLGVLRGCDISSPTAPIIRSSIFMPSVGTDIKPTDAFGSTAAVACQYGMLARVNLADVTAPYVYQVGKVADGGDFNSLQTLAFDGQDLHAATYRNGYLVIPLTFSAAPAEDPNRRLSQLGKIGRVALCPGSPLSISAHFVAIPAVTSYQWLKLIDATGVWVPLAEGPTGNGSSLSGTTTATLTISNAAIADMGTYGCRAGNTCGTGMSTGTFVTPGGYANCDGSMVMPVLNVNDFQCFLNRFAAASPYANCDGSTAAPVLNVNDFQCFINEFAAACP